MNRKSVILILFFAFLVGILVYSPVSNSNGPEELSLTFYGNYGCAFSHEKSDLIENYVNQHPEINATHLWIPNNLSIAEYYNEMAALGEVSPAPPPAGPRDRGRARARVRGEAVRRRTRSATAMTTTATRCATTGLSAAGARRAPASRTAARPARGSRRTELHARLHGPAPPAGASRCSRSRSTYARRTIPASGRSPRCLHRGS